VVPQNKEKWIEARSHVGGNWVRAFKAERIVASQIKSLPLWGTKAKEEYHVLIACCS
jgi:hypothetical protein